MNLPPELVDQLPPGFDQACTNAQLMLALCELLGIVGAGTAGTIAALAPDADLGRDDHDPDREPYIWEQ